MKLKMCLLASALTACAFGCTSPATQKTLVRGSGGSIDYGCFNISTAPVEGLELTSNCDAAMQIGIIWTGKDLPLYYRLGPHQSRAILFQGAQLTPVSIQAPQDGVGEKAPGVVEVKPNQALGSTTLYNSAVRYVFVRYTIHSRATPTNVSGVRTIRPGSVSDVIDNYDPDHVINIELSEYEPY